MGVRPRLCKGGATIGLAWHNRQPSLEVHRMMGPFRRLAHLIDQGRQLDAALAGDPFALTSRAAACNSSSSASRDFFGSGHWLCGLSIT